MDPSITYGLLSAVAYGAADYLSQFAGKNLGTWRASFYYYTIGLAALSVWIGLGSSDFQFVLNAPRAGWLISMGAGLSLLAAVVLFTQGLIRGSVAVVAPVTASYGAVSTLLASISGERFSFWTGCGIFLTIIGVCGAAVSPSAAQSTEQPSGVGWACVAAIAYGVGFWLQGLAVPMMGPLLPIWTVYATGLAVMGTLQLLRVIDLSPPKSWTLMAPGLGAAVLSVIAFVALTLGLRAGQPAVVVVLSSLTSAVTVILARVISQVRMGWYQWVSIFTIVVGLSLMRRS